MDGEPGRWGLDGKQLRRLHRVFRAAMVADPRELARRVLRLREAGRIVPRRLRPVRPIALSMPANVRTTLPAIVDGLSNTVQVINFGQNLTIKGSFPFSNSGHPAGCNMVFCDGAVRFITASIDGTVYSKILTPAGSRLPNYARQLPVSQDAFAQ
jgi:prepilin-type processing-associated H-X9-DG protein